MNGGHKELVERLFQIHRPCAHNDGCSVCDAGNYSGPTGGYPCETMQIVLELADRGARKERRASRDAGR